MTDYSKKDKQYMLACLISEAFYPGGSFLKPGDRHGDFWLPPSDVLLGQYSYNVRLCDIAWAIVAQRMIDFVDRAYRVIDHAWMLVHKAKPHEPWGFVTEPYAPPGYADLAAAFINNEMGGWMIEAHALVTEVSSWNPGRCTPIVVLLHEGAAGHFQRAALRWALERFDEESDDSSLTGWPLSSYSILSPTD